MRQHDGTRSFKAILSAGLATLALLLAALGTATLSAAPDAGQQPEVAQAGAPGIYVVDDLYDLDREAYHLAGGYVTFRWSQFEGSVRGAYDWSELDGWLNLQDELGRAAGFGISMYNGRKHSGGDGLSAIPLWMRDLPNVYVQDWPEDWKIPKYWYPLMLEAYGEFIEALGARYRNDPRLEFVSIGTGMYGETRACDPWDLDILQGAGLTMELWVQTVKDITDLYVAAFSDAGELKKTLLQQYAPPTFDSWERPQIANYSIANGVGLSFNGLYPDDEKAVIGDQRASEAWEGKYDQMIDPVTYQPSLELPLAWETYDYMLCDSIQVYWGMINGLNKHADYFRLNRDLFKAEGTGVDLSDNLAVFNWAKRYMGVTLATTPSVWVAMREHRLPWRTCWQIEKGQTELGPWFPQWGNYSFWLYQDDNVAGGRTRLETNDPTVTAGFGNCPNPGISPGGGPPCQSDVYRSFLPLGREGYVLRRTDQGTGNPYMWFKVDDGYINGGSTQVRITVTYLDFGSDTWSLHYDAADGTEKAAVPQGAANPWVQKLNTGIWKQAVFDIEDARFANSLTGGSDFRLDCRNDGDERIHFVDVTKGTSTPPTPAPTPTNTPTGQAGPTTTTTPTPTVTPTISGEPVCWQGQIAALDDDTMVKLVSPPENASRDSVVRIGTRPPWGESWPHANGFRFSSVPVPQGSAVTEAYVSFVPNYMTDAPVHVWIYGEDADSSEPFTDTQTLAHLRPRTTAQVAWSVSVTPTYGVRFDTPDLAPLVHEVVNRAGWYAGSSLSVLIESDAATQNYLDVWAYDYDPDLSAQIEICYVPGGGPVNTATPTSTPTATRTATASPTATLTPTQMPVGTDTPTPTPTPSPTMTSTPSPSPTPTATPDTGVIHGEVWHDLDRDGVKEEGEPPLAGAEVRLKNENHLLMGLWVTQADGTYRFADLPAGLYHLSEIDPPGYASSTLGEIAVFLNPNKALVVHFGDYALPTDTPTPVHNQKAYLPVILHWHWLSSER